MEPEARKIGLSLKDIGKVTEKENNSQGAQLDIKASDNVDEEKVDDVKKENV
jgi:DNA-binding transcriptional MerR regulator